MKSLLFDILLFAGFVILLLAAIQNGSMFWCITSGVLLVCTALEIIAKAVKHKD